MYGIKLFLYLLLLLGQVETIALNSRHDRINNYQYHYQSLSLDNNDDAHRYEPCFPT